MEMWRDIEGFEGLYQVSNFGKIKSLPKSNSPGINILNPKPNKYGYLKVHLYKEGKRYKKQVHRLVGAAFISNPDNKPCINHIDSTRTNNNAENLEWVTYKENYDHSKSKGRQPVRYGEDVGKQAKLTTAQVIEIKKLLRNGKLLQKDIAKLFNVNPRTISKIKCEIRWSHIKLLEGT